LFEKTDPIDKDWPSRREGKGKLGKIKADLSASARRVGGENNPRRTIFKRRARLLDARVSCSAPRKTGYPKVADDGVGPGAVI